MFEGKTNSKASLILLLNQILKLIKAKQIIILKFNIIKSKQNSIGISHELITN